MTSGAAVAYNVRMAAKEERVGYRLKPELRRRVRAHVKRMQAKSPGLTVSEADAVRTLLDEALAIHEATR